MTCLPLVLPGHGQPSHPNTPCLAGDSVSTGSRDQRCSGQGLSRPEEGGMLAAALLGPSGVAALTAWLGSVSRALPRGDGCHRCDSPRPMRPPLFHSLVLFPDTRFTQRATRGPQEGPSRSPPRESLLSLHLRTAAPAAGCPILFNLNATHTLCYPTLCRRNRQTFYQVPDSRRFQFCGLCGLRCGSSLLPSWWENSRRRSING